MPKQLKDCPHCHANQEDVVPHPDGHGTIPSLTVEVWNRPYPRAVAYVLCNKCGARGPEKETADAAKDAWGYEISIDEIYADACNAEDCAGGGGTNEHQ